VSDVHAEGCSLKWKKPKDDGGSPIKYYEVEKFDKETGRWTRVGKTEKPEMDVTGLLTGHEYMFRVTAVNEEGDSEPLATLHGTVAKNPYGEWDHQAPRCWSRSNPFSVQMSLASPAHRTLSTTTTRRST